MSGRRPFEFEVCGRGGGLAFISIAAMPFSRPRGGGPRFLGSLPGGTAGNGLSKEGPAPGGRRPVAAHIVNDRSETANSDFTYHFLIVFLRAVYHQGSRAGHRIQLEVVLLEAAGALIWVAPKHSAATLEMQSNRRMGLHMLAQGRS
jgi:hypothetical protein